MTLLTTRSFPSTETKCLIPKGFSWSFQATAQATLLRTMTKAKQPQELLSMFLYRTGNNRGFSMIEIVIAIFIIVVALGSILNVAVLSLKSSFDAKAALQAQSYAQEALEAVRNFRDGVAWNADDPLNEYDGLGVAAKGVAYYISKSSDNPAKWKLVQGQETLGVFTRSIVFAQGLRDAQNNLVASGGTADPDTVRVAATVSWSEQGTARQSQLIMYLTNWVQ